MFLNIKNHSSLKSSRIGQGVTPLKKGKKGFNRNRSYEQHTLGARTITDRKDQMYLCSTVTSVCWCVFDSRVQGPHQCLHSRAPLPRIIPGCPQYSIYHPWMILGRPKDSQSPSNSAYTKDYPKTSQVFVTVHAKTNITPHITENTFLVLYCSPKYAESDGIFTTFIAVTSPKF